MRTVPITISFKKQDYKMGFFSIKQPKKKQAEEKDTYYIEPAKEEEENHDAWTEQENYK